MTGIELGSSPPPDVSETMPVPRVLSFDGATKHNKNHGKQNNLAFTACAFFFRWGGILVEAPQQRIHV